MQSSSVDQVVVERAPEGGYTARALGESIFTEADTEPELRLAVQDAVHCDFDEGESPKVIRLHFVRDELLVARSDFDQAVNRSVRSDRAAPSPAPP